MSKSAFFESPHFHFPSDASICRSMETVDNNRKDDANQGNEDHAFAKATKDDDEQQDAVNKSSTNSESTFLRWCLMKQLSGNWLKGIWIGFCFAACIQFILTFFWESWHWRIFSISPLKMHCIICTCNAVFLMFEGAFATGKYVKPIWLKEAGERFADKFKRFLAKIQLEVLLSSLVIAIQSGVFVYSVFQSILESGKLEQIAFNLNILYSFCFLVLIPLILFSFNAERKNYQ